MYFFRIIYALILYTGRKIRIVLASRAQFYFIFYFLLNDYIKQLTRDELYLD